MKRFHITTPDRAIRPLLQDKINHLTKPKGALGELEELALQVGWVQQTLTPTLSVPHNLLFAGDHGIVEEGVSFSPKEVTWQQLHNFLQGGAGVNLFCRQHGFKLVLVDAGVDYDFPPGCGIIDRKVRKGTRNFLHEAAMSEEEMNLCLERGAEMVRAIAAEGCNLLSLGEMGIGNTSASSLWMHTLTEIPLIQCIGAGSGLPEAGVQHKYEVLSRAVEHFEETRTPSSIMTRFGGYEMVMAVGAMLQAAELKMLILIDGFIMTNCLLAAMNLQPEVIHYAIFGHCGDEVGHRLLLEVLQARPLLDLGLRLGEGTGAICAYPLLDSAVRMINEMNTFEEGKVTKYFV